MASIHHPKQEKLNARHAREAAEALLREGRHLRDDIEDRALDKIWKAEREIEAYSHEAMRFIRKHPLRSVLIAGGIGLICSFLLRK